MQTRRKFLRHSAIAAAGFLVSDSLLGAVPFDGKKNTLTILHTNDVHSRLDPMPMDGTKYQGMGGVEARAALISSIREQEDHVLLFDSGDIFQGTPYFNFFKGEPEIKAMTAMGYDAATIGNHDFDAGIENFADQLKHANFPLVVSNYDFRNTAMENNSLPYKIFRKGKLKIGVTGAGIELEGLVPTDLYGKTQYLDPIKKVNEAAYTLKKEENCDMVICLSHLGYQYRDNKISDVVLAKESENIDLILGGHTHTFLESPVSVANKNGKEVLINQVGWGGIILGRIDVEFSKRNSKKIFKSNTVLVNKKTSE